MDGVLDRVVAMVRGCSCTRETWRKRLKDVDRHRLMVSFWGGIGFIGLGTTLVIFGPTLLDIANHLSVGVGSLAILFAVRAMGAAVGSIGSGFVMDRLQTFSYTILVGILLAAFATTAAVPLSVHIVMLGGIMFCSGVSTGCLANGTHIVLLRMWKEKVGLCMQAVHFAFALGAFFAPLLAKPFISDEADDDDDTKSNSSVFSCSEIVNELSFFDDNGSLVNGCEKCSLNCSILQLFDSLCANATNSKVINHYGELLNASNCTDNPQDERILFGWAYWITASLYIPTLIAFVYYSVRLDIFKRKTLHRNDNDTSSDNDGDILESEQPQNSTSREVPLETSTPEKQSRCYHITLLTLLFLFMFFYVGLEVAFGSFIFTVAVKGELQFSKQDAALLASVFWGTFAFARLFSLVLVLLKTPASWMMTGNMTGSLIAATIMFALSHNPTAIWIGSALLGSSYASIYPTTMTWFAEHADKLTGKSTAVIITGGILGNISLPAAVGSLVGRVSYDSLFYFTFAGILISAVFLGLLFLTAHLERRWKSKVEFGSAKVRYAKLPRDGGNENNVQTNLNESDCAEVDSSEEVEILQS